MTHHGLYGAEHIPHKGIVKVPGFVTFKMQCGIAILAMCKAIAHHI